jgi:ferredoxin/flavodoxin---NADP+ reductase
MMIEVEILEHKKIAKDVFEIRFPKIFSFIAGQLIGIIVEGFPLRIYSLASGEEDNYLAVLFDIKKEGKVSPILGKMTKGDHVHISEPYGNFTCTDEGACWIASGTGIAPFYSMLRSGFGSNKSLIQGGRTIESFYYQNEFLPVLGKHYIRCCSKETSEGFYAGRLTQYIKELELLPRTQKYYLCGSAEMVVEVRDILISRNIPFTNILAEIYF